MLKTKEYYAVYTHDEKPPLTVTQLQNGTVMVWRSTGKSVLLPSDHHPQYPSKLDQRRVFQQLRVINHQKCDRLLTVDERNGRLIVSDKHPQPSGGHSQKSFASSAAFMPSLVRVYDIPGPACKTHCVYALSDDMQYLLYHGRIIQLDPDNDYAPKAVVAFAFPANLTVSDAMFVPGTHDLMFIGYDQTAQTQAVSCVRKGDMYVTTRGQVPSAAGALTCVCVRSKNKWTMVESVQINSKFNLPHSPDTHLLHVDPDSLQVLVGQNNDRVFQLSPDKPTPQLVARFVGSWSHFMHCLRGPHGSLILYRQIAEEGLDTNDWKTVKYERILLESSCVVYNTHPLSGAVIMNAVPEVEWLAKTPGHTGPHHYQLRFAMSRDVHTSSAWHTTYDNLDGKPLEMRWPAGNNVPSNTQVTISLYKWRNNRHEQKCQYRVGEVRFPVSALTQTDSKSSLLLRDHTGDAQASLRFTKHQNAEAAAKALGAAQPENEEVLEFPAHYSSEHVDGGLKPRGAVAKVLRRLTVKYYEQKRVPVWMICMLRNEPAVGEMYLAHVLNHVTRWLHYKDAHEWAQDEKGANRFEVLSQVMSFYTAQEPYLFDKTFSISKQKMVMSDQFSITRDAPDSKSRAGDCEDFTADQISVFMAINAMKEEQFPEDSPLHKLVKLAHSYCAFTADTSIYNGKEVLPETPHTDDPDSVDLHMFTVLVPWSKVYKLLQNAHEAKEPTVYEKVPKHGAGYPALLLESTEPCVSDWALPTQPMHLFGCDVTHAQSSLGQPCRTVWNTIRYQTTRDTYVKDQFYRLCTCLYSQQLFDITGCPSFLPVLRHAQTGERAYGVSVKWLARFEEKDVRMGLKPLPAATPDEMRLFKKLQDRLPWVAPVQFAGGNITPSDNVYPSSRNFDVIKLFVREQDWKETHETTIKHTLQRMNELSHTCTYSLWGSKQSLVITNGARVVMYHVLIDKR